MNRLFLIGLFLVGCSKFEPESDCGECGLMSML